MCLTVFAASLNKLIIVLNKATEPRPAVGTAIAEAWSQGWEAVILTVFTFAVAWFVVGLLGYHCYLIWTAQTTYEQIKRYHYGEVNPWHRGPWRNITELLCQPPRARFLDMNELKLRHAAGSEILRRASYEKTATSSLHKLSGVIEVKENNATVCGLELCSIGAEED